MRHLTAISIRGVLAAFGLIALARTGFAEVSIWTSHGPTGSGLILDVAVGNAAALAATPNGVFRSTDGGLHWEQAGLAGQWISQVVARPGTDRVLARNASNHLFATRDGGQTWTPLGIYAVSAVAIDPYRPSTAYIASVESIFRSTDSDSHWELLASPPRPAPGLAFAFDSREGTLYFLSSIGLNKSTDGGLSWSSVGPLAIASPSAIAVGPYGAVSTATQGAFCRSLDSAATWRCSPFRASPTRIVEVAVGSGSASRILVTSDAGLFISDDGGLTFSPSAALGSTGYLQALDAEPVGSLVLAGTDTAVYRSRDRGESWTRGNQGLQAVLVESLALDPSHPSTIWAGGAGFAEPQGPGLLRSTDDGQSWSAAGGAGAPRSVSIIAFDTQHPSTLYAGGNPLYRSDDGGASWTPHAIPGEFLSALALEPSDSRHVWAATPQGLFHSTDGAQSWSSRPAIAQAIYSLLFDRRHPGRIYAGSFFDHSSGYYAHYPEGGSIFVSQDNGGGWAKNAQNFGSGVVAIAVDPFHDGVVYAGTGNGGIYRSEDAGTTWHWSGSGGIRYGVVSIVPDPVREGRLYAATSGGVYRTVDDGATWHILSNGLSPANVGPLVVSPDGHWLHAGTLGGGVFELDLETDQFPSTCTADATHLCLVGNRYAVEMMASKPGGGGFDPGTARPLSDRSGYFSLPTLTGDPEFPEVVVKMLGDGTFGRPGAPIFHSSLTTRLYVLKVTDTFTGERHDYANDPANPLCGGTGLAFASSEGSSTIARPERSLDGQNVLYLLHHRFSVKLEALNPHDGRPAHGLAVKRNERFGYFSLPDITGDPTFPEVVVKMVDATATSGKYWFFYTGLTGLDYTLTLTDTVSGIVRTYSSPGSLCGAADTGLSPSGNDAPTEPPRSGNGTVTWESIETTRALCPELRNQVGQSDPVHVTLESRSASVILSLGHGDDEPTVFRGTRIGDSITATNDAPNGGLACPDDTSVTPLTGGDLSATLTGDAIDGHYTEVYGSGADAVIFHFHFRVGPFDAE